MNNIFSVTLSLSTILPYKRDNLMLYVLHICVLYSAYFSHLITSEINLAIPLMIFGVLKAPIRMRQEKAFSIKLSNT